MSFAIQCVAVLCAMTFSLSVVGQDKFSAVVNPGFELSDESSNTKLLGWKTFDDSATIKVDERFKNAGKQSLQLMRKTGAQFSAVGQTVDAAPYRGKVVVLQAALRYEGEVAGSIGLWLRADAPTLAGASMNSYQNPPANDGRWVMRRTMLFVPEQSKQLVFGAANGAPGSLWIDDVTLLSLDDTMVGVPPPSEAAAKYITEAVSKIRGVALNADKVDWAKTEKLANQMAAGAVAADETYVGVSFMLSQLNDRHSKLIPAILAKSQRAEVRIGNFGIASERVGLYGYISVPSYVGGDKERAKAFVDDIRQRITTINTPKVCGWIVDLRQNTGGNMWPMISGLAPLVGEGLAGLFESPRYKTEWKINSTGEVMSGNNKTTGSAPASFMDGGKARVAVLTGPRTASSGEAVAVAFRGRHNARSFGEPTMGLSTANTTVPMSDGALLAITTAVYVDRAGTKYGGPLVPDELVQGGSTTVAGDPVVKAAMAWLGKQGLCEK
jgi:carboxyl-terminal processing protease